MNYDDLNTEQQAAVARLGQAAAQLSYEQRLALLAQVEDQILTGP
jgi:hypothetical protein